MNEKIYTAKAPKPVGPYSQAIRANGFVFASGQIPINPQTGEILRGSIEEQTHQVLENLREVLEAAGSSLAKVVRATVYLSDLRNFEAMNATYATYFGDTRPARSTIQAAELPKGVDVEIDAIAVE
ncbi:MAG: RidA family protein [Acidobacteria bacterium]|nr:MAG: RidA family protein [Acidobacteriota bacterium]